MSATRFPSDRDRAVLGRSMNKKKGIFLMTGLSLQELDAQFSELLPEREALGCINLKWPGHHLQHHHHHCEPKPCEPKQAPCPPHQAPPPCPPHQVQPCPPHQAPPPCPPHQTPPPCPPHDVH